MGDLVGWLDGLIGVGMYGWIIGEAFEEFVELAPDTQDSAADVPAGGIEAVQKAPAVEAGEKIFAEDEWRGNAEKRKIGWNWKCIFPF